jgi:hypothetical protein
VWSKSRDETRFSFDKQNCRKLAIVYDVFNGFALSLRITGIMIVKRQFCEELVAYQQLSWVLKFVRYVLANFEERHILIYNI